MSFVVLSAALVVGGGVGAYCAVRALREGSSPGDVAFYSAGGLALLSAFVVWQLLFVSMSGNMGEYLVPSLDTRAQRGFVMYYAGLSALVTALVTSGIALLLHGKRKA